MPNRAKKETKTTLCRKIKVEDAVGSLLAHDITEIRPGEFKGACFRKGYRVKPTDIDHLRRLGKRHLYILNLNPDHIHEDEAVLALAEALAGPGVSFDRTPREGKIRLLAGHDGLFKLRSEPLVEFNLMPDVMCAAIHDNTPVLKNQVLAGTRAVPLVIHSNVLDEAVRLARRYYPIFSIKPFQRLKAGLIITGNEVYSGLIEDRFEAVVKAKLDRLGARLTDRVILPDDENRIAGQIRTFIDNGCDLIITTGGMSVDPDDVTRAGIRKVRVDEMYYGAAVLPGAMFLMAYKNGLPIVGIPACALYHPATVFDLMLPRLLAGERPTSRDLARLAPGGLCLNCDTCRYPACSFGKSS